MKKFNYQYTIDEYYKVTIHDTVNNLEWITTTEPETIPNHFTFHFKDNDLIAYSNGNGYIIPLVDEPNAQWILKYNDGTNYDPPVYLDDDGAASLLKACEEAYITPPLTVSSYDRGKRPDDEELPAKRETMSIDQMPPILDILLNQWNLNIQPEQVSVTYKEYRRSLPKECYRNAFNYVSGNINTRSYILGYLVYRGIPIEHAWVKENDVYYDITLDNTEQDQYYKLIEISGSDLMDYILQTRELIDIYTYKRIKENKI